ncbi:hypothetical protein [Marinicrinis sediminis]|uniref:Uncharacterized protein n=1 Tax=Marinicrinis sediminis TaxID=1652465 RepID=A0ABW5R8X3_9BACL
MNEWKNSGECEVIKSTAMSNEAYTLIVEQKQGTGYRSRMLLDQTSIYTSFWWETVEKAEQEAMDYYTHLRKKPFE